MTCRVQRKCVEIMMTLMAPTNNENPLTNSITQVILGFVRPKPDAVIRPVWNSVHHNLGRVTILSAWVTIYLGVYMAHGDLDYQSDYVTWLCPITACMGTLVLVDVVLTLYLAWAHHHKKSWCVDEMDLSKLEASMVSNKGMGEDPARALWPFEDVRQAAKLQAPTTTLTSTQHVF
jgi:hypothetical protein